MGTKTPKPARFGVAVLLFSLWILSILLFSFVGYSIIRHFWPEQPEYVAVKSWYG